MIEYKGQLISKNSDAYKMWIEKDFKKLDAHGTIAKRSKEARRLL